MDTGITSELVCVPTGTKVRSRMFRSDVRSRLAELQTAEIRLRRAAPALLAAVQRLLQCPDLNLELERETVAAITEAERAVLLVQGEIRQ